MHLNIRELKVFISTILGIIVYYLGGMDILLKTLLILIVFDYFTGIVKGICNKQLSSLVGFSGISKKVFMLIIVATAFLIQQAVSLDFPIREIVVMFFIGNEGISILENSAEIGVPIPEKLREILYQLKDTNQ